MHQDDPFCIQIELVEGCNLLCDFCGVSGIRSHVADYKFMTYNMAHIVVDRILESGWNSRIEFAMHGEPSVHPNLLQILPIFRDRLPKHQLMMTSNGSGFQTPERIQAVFDAGLNVLAIDQYGTAGWNDKVSKAVYESCIKWYNYPQEKEGNPHKRHPKGAQLIALIEDISSAKKGNHAVLNNHCGAGMPKDESQAGKRCAKPFREFSIRWDGKVSICCNDFRGEACAGDILEDSLDTIWNGDVFTAARHYLYHGMRLFTPCKGCNATSYRVGLLPDKLGKEDLSLPLSSHQTAVEGALQIPPLAPIVKRDWEK